MVLFTFYLTLANSLLIIGSANLNKWISLNSSGKDVKLFKNGLSFWNAVISCTNESNSDLVKVENMNESIKLAQMLEQNNVSRSWIGLTDFSSEGRFYWINDQSAAKVNVWDTGFPKDYRNASDCVLMNRNGADQYKWIDTHCDSKLPFICMRGTKTKVSTPSLLPDHSHYTHQCQKPFFQVDGDCFWISHELMTWNDSRLLCQGKSPESDLASIRTAVQQEYFAALISGSFSGFWIGLNYYNDEYQWILQQDFKFTRWGKNQPKDMLKKNCIFISTNERNLGNWNTAVCSDKFQTICQTLKKNNLYDVNETTNTPDSTYDNALFVPGSCKKHRYYQYHDSCYRLFSDKKLSYNDGIRFCKNQTFKNDTGFNFLIDTISFPSAGEKKLILADLRRRLFDQEDVWINITNSLINNTSPSRAIKHLCFKLLTNGVVNSSDCDDNSRSTPLCKYQLDNFDMESLNSNRLSATCPRNWTFFNSNCYFYSKYKNRKLWDANQFCLRSNATLISINMAQQNFIFDFLKKSYYSKGSDIWIGLNASYSTNGKLRLIWTNGNLVSYTNLESVTISETLETSCAVFVLKSGIWKLVNCTESKARAVCQKPAYIKPMQDNIRTIPNKKVVELTTDIGYKLMYDLLPWTDANEKCKTLSKSPHTISTLATINSYDDLRSIQLNKINKKYQRFWIGLSGLYDHFDNVFLKWVDGSKVVFQNYQYQNLMNLTGSENCVMMDLKSGKWFARNCDINLPFICQIMYNRTTENKTESKLFHIFSEKHNSASFFCPEGFLEHSQKCYRVIEDKQFDFEKADKYCQGLVPYEHREKASLASIESRFENSFVYSLLSSSMDSVNDTRYWIGERYTTNSDLEHICSGISAHPDPYIGARWFAERCSEKLKFICSSLKILIFKHQQPRRICPKNYVEYSTTSGTYCYHFESTQNKLEEARRFCTLQKNHDSLLSIPSHFHFHFLLSQLEGEGLSRDNPIWLGLKIESRQRLHHWQWDNGKDVRYSFWNRVPNISDGQNGSLCLYLLQEKDKDAKFGMQIDYCRRVPDRGYIICEHFIRNAVSDKNVIRNKNCVSNSQMDIYEGTNNNSIDGIRCIRWDLLPRPNTIILSMRAEKGIHNYIEHHSNECRFISSMENVTTFCAIGINSANKSPKLAECAVESCAHKILHHNEEAIFKEHHSNVMTVVIVTLMLLLCVIACIALLSWRRWNKTSVFGGYLRRGQFSMLNSQPRGTSFNNPIYSPVSC